MATTLPYTIMNGQAQDAVPVMANFNALANVGPAGGGVAAAAGANADITSLTGLTTPLAVAEGGTGDTGTQWSTQTVTPTPASGTLTTASAVWRFKVIGKTAFFSMNCLITTNGTGAGNVMVPMPTGWTAKAVNGYGGRETQVTGASLQAQILAATTYMFIQKYDATYPGGNGYNLAFSGVIELT